MLILQAVNLPNDGRAAHGFFGRVGGVSTGLFESLNCGPGSDDARKAVNENRARVLRHLSGGADAQLLTLYQIHSPTVVTVTEGWESGPQADAMVTNKRGFALGILTADCAPVLMADMEAGVIGAAHAGWKGALGGVAEAAVAAMEALGAKRERIAAAIGPCISQPNYEVGTEFGDRFRAADTTNARFFAAGNDADHWQFDLKGFAVHRLQKAGLRNISPIAACTYGREAAFFSYRRATHRGEKDYGRQVSAIVLK